jgi:hypothetical protein
MPGRAQIEAALNAHEACGGGGANPCDPPLRYRLTGARCLRLPRDPSYPGRILCRYAGTVRRGRDAAIRLEGDCAYFRPAGRRGWRVDAYPDADMCED